MSLQKKRNRRYANQKGKETALKAIKALAYQFGTNIPLINHLETRNWYDATSFNHDIAEPSIHDPSERKNGSYSDLADHLNTLGYKTVRGKKWTRFAIRSLLQRPEVKNYLAGSHNQSDTVIDRNSQLLRISRTVVTRYKRLKEVRGRHYTLKLEDYKDLLHGLNQHELADVITKIKQGI